MPAASTLPGDRRRDWLSAAWLLPSWILSLILHAAVLLVFAVWLNASQRSPVGFTNEPSREVGIVLKSVGKNTDPDAVPNDSEQLDPSPSESDQTSTTVAEPTTAAPVTPEANPAATEMLLPTLGAGVAFPSAVQADPRDLVRPGNVASAGAAASGAMPGTAFMGIADEGTRVVFVVDCSASMANYSAMQSAKAALVSSIQTLSETQQFQVIFYSQTPRMLSVRGKPSGELMFATEINKAFARQYVSGIQPDLGTDHMPALRMALRMAPEVIYFLTDADEPQLSAKELNELQRLNQGRTNIHCIEFGIDSSLEIDNFLKRLARQNGGSYRYYDVKRLRSRG